MAVPGGSRWTILAYTKSGVWWFIYVLYKFAFCEWHKRTSAFLSLFLRLCGARWHRHCHFSGSGMTCKEGFAPESHAGFQDPSFWRCTDGRCSFIHKGDFKFCLVLNWQRVRLAWRHSGWDGESRVGGGPTGQRHGQIPAPVLYAPLPLWVPGPFYYTWVW